MPKKTKIPLEDWLSKNTVSVLAGVAIGALLFALVIAGLYVFVFRASPVNADAATMGQVGDYFGGLLNPVFSFLSMLALLVALVIQGKELRMSRKELKLSRKEMRKSGEALESQNYAIEHQRFEQTFFAWLGTYRSMLAAVEKNVRSRIMQPGTSPATTTYNGIQALTLLMNDTSRALADRANDLIPASEWASAKSAAGEEWGEQLMYLGTTGWGPQISRLSQDAWENMYRTNEAQLGGLFRVLYRLLLWINSHDSRSLSDAQKWLYVSIIRAQLSETELSHLFFNGNSGYGSSMKPLINRYALFDNLTLLRRPECLVMKDTPPDSVGYSSAAFDSRLARQVMDLPKSAEETLALAAKGPHQVALDMSAKKDQGQAT